MLVATWSLADTEGVEWAADQLTETIRDFYGVEVSPFAAIDWQDDDGQQIKFSSTLGHAGRTWKFEVFDTADGQRSLTVLNLLDPVRGQPEVRVQLGTGGRAQGTSHPTSPLLFDIMRRLDVRLDGKPALVVGTVNAETVGTLTSYLLASERRTPVVLMSGGTVAVERGQDLVRRMAGAALVAHVDGEASWELTRRLGSGLGCYAGAIRLLWPALDRTPPAAHPLWVSRRVASQGWEATRDEILDKVAAFGAAEQESQLERDLKSEIQERARREKVTLKRDLADARSEIQRLQAELMSRTDVDVDAIFDQQNEEISTLHGRLQAVETDRDQALNMVAELDSEKMRLLDVVEALQQALSHRAWNQPGTDHVESVTIDSTVDEMIQRLADPSGPLVMTEAALKAWRESGYPEDERMLNSLRRLETAAQRWRESKGSIGSRLKEWLGDEFGVRYANSDHELERRGLDTFEFEGRAWSRVPHIKVDDAKHPGQVGRIYFAIDSDNLRWIVDHVGQKLYVR
jgi:hypothetical protein